MVSVINVIVAGDLSGIVAVLLNDLRHVAVDSIELQVVISAPGDGSAQGVPGAAGPQDNLVSLPLSGFS